MSLDETYLNPPSTPEDIEETMAAAKSRAGSCPTPEDIVKILSEVSSTRWPIAVSLVDGGQTATELAKAVGKSVSWTLKQAKQMETARILGSAPDPLNQTRGLVYTLKDGVREVLEQRDEYAAAKLSLERGASPTKLRLGEKSENLSSSPSLASRVGQIVNEGLEVMALDADAAAFEYGFIPYNAVRIGTGDEAKYLVKTGKAIAVDTFEKFVEATQQLVESGESAPALRTQPQANPSE